MLPKGSCAFYFGRTWWTRLLKQCLNHLSVIDMQAETALQQPHLTMLRICLCQCKQVLATSQAGMPFVFPMSVQFTHVRLVEVTHWKRAIAAMLWGSTGYLFNRRATSLNKNALGPSPLQTPISLCFTPPRGGSAFICFYNIDRRT